MHPHIPTIILYLLRLSFLLDTFDLLCRKKKCLLFQQHFELFFCCGSEWNTPGTAQPVDQLNPAGSLFFLPDVIFSGACSP